MPGSLTSQILDRHIDVLCSEHAILREAGGRTGRAFQRGRGRRRTLHIRIAPVKGQVTYLVALHEIGHLVGRGRSGTRLEKEAEAWRYALDASLVEPTDAARRRIGKRLRSYVTWAELRQSRRRPPSIPPPDSAFWAR